ncbi:hypothetical protein EZV62_016822 [Acer yangbiense]|uniref:F-box domain-containing protein n=1 Tax=Acer yangbiense TaxID=1000413 RepID=A0A5C7HPJ6_9ROSI|nr:hypothetical protein EZV62_016822 [Acer yangbiense]
MSTLLPELIIEILLRLPIKSICRLKCASKSWLALITHPQFIKMHLVRTRKQKLLLCNAYLYLVDLERSLEDKVHPKLDQLNIIPNTRFIDIVYGSNGLFCIKYNFNDGFLFIYNPSTRESKKILDDVPSVVRESNLYCFGGFGYVESIDDYKFVRVLDYENTLQIFSLRNNSWKIVMGNFPVREPNFIHGVSLNGAVHWGTICYPDNLGVITVFDLAEEKFKTFPLPISNPPNPPESWQCIVHDIGEYLCVTFEVYGSRTTEFVDAVKGIWIMKKYGVKESWTRIVKSHDLYNPIPLCLWEDDGIILYSHIGKPKRVLCYDEKDGKIRKECVFDGNYRMYAYIESLVSPKYNFEYSTTQGFPHYIAQSQLQSTGQDPSSSSVILDISGLLTEDQLV